MNVVLDAGADDIRSDGDRWEILARPEAQEAVVKALEGASIPVAEAAIAMVPKNLVKLEGKNVAGMLRLSEALEDHDDVQSVYSNFDFDEKDLEAMA
jgi:transcriptional/translational regulatory protein YebC/TACO1